MRETCSTMGRAAIGLGFVGLACALPLVSVAQTEPCAGLGGISIPGGALSLPAGDVTITDASLSTVEGGDARFCRILARIDPVDRSAPPILAQINLPERWNGKYLQYGGGGLNGTLVTGLAGVRDAPPGPVPVALSYATAGTDAGHPNAKPAIQVFALNAEATVNHAYAAYKKTADLARILIARYYGRQPTVRYFIGGSEGGREALMFAQRYPTAFNGIVATVPVLNWTGVQLATYDHWLLARGKGWMNKDQVALWSGAVVGVCDDKDGLRDGVVADYRACDATAAIARLACVPGGDTARCLTPEQLALVSLVRSPRRYGFALANAEMTYPAFPSGGETLPGSVVPFVVDPVRPAPEDPAFARYSVGDVRYFITRDPGFSGPFDERLHRDRVMEVSRLMDMTDPDLSAFRKAGGKLIIKANGADFVHSPHAVTRYYEQVVARLGRAAANDFVRLFVAPGTNHGGQGVKADGSPVPDRVDLLGAIDVWVTRRKAPADLVLAGYDKGGIARTRWPMCAFPRYLHYAGGDPATAASYRCKRPA